MQSDYQANLTEYHNLTRLECLNAYSHPLGPETNLLLVSSDEEFSERFNSSLLSWGFHNPSPRNITHHPLCTLWLSKKKCELLGSFTTEELDEFRLANHSIDYCLNRPTDPVGVAAQVCYLECSPLIILSMPPSQHLDIKKSPYSYILVVAIFNTIKCICILVIIIWKREPTLSVLGDAIASFLSKPDTYTKYLGITSKIEIVRSDKLWSGSKGLPLRWESRPSRWCSAATTRRWIFTMVS